MRETASEAVALPAGLAVRLEPPQAVFADAPAEPAGPSWMERMSAALEAGDGDQVEMLLAEEPAGPEVSENTNRVANLSLPPGPQSPPAAPPAPSADPLELERLMAAISAEIYAHLARASCCCAPTALPPSASRRSSSAGSFLAELERLKALERAGRMLAAREERQAEADEAEELAAFRAELASRRVMAE
jgi:hypothetical protein